ncbi:MULTISPECIES: hypothetical protein [Variovorax]|jgi:hypothetical protein|uniref:hypothetical protein n=1 Tax=Variovorax TaxID=34072 RepID=UPI00037E8561|nr:MULTISPECIES: hypothetical protein [Variovorax]MBB3642653.1 hypothetical protein [Variovorax sp. BK613]RTD88541.1 hypothetical protein EJO68_23030 [Variovorax sp. 369]
MKRVGDKGESLREFPESSRTSAPPGLSRIALTRGALRGTIALIAGLALVASIPYWGGMHFPVTSLVIYVAGMVFVAMPLCLYYESLLMAQAAASPDGCEAPMPR